MKAVRNFIHSTHNAVIALVIIAILALITFSGNFSALVLPHNTASVPSVMVRFVVGVILCTAVFTVEKCSEHFLNDRF